MGPTIPDIRKELNELEMLFCFLRNILSPAAFEHFVSVHERLEKKNGVQLIEVRKR